MRDIWFLITDHKGIVKILAILIAIFCVVSIGVSSYTSTMKVQEQQEQQAKKKEKEKQIKNSSVKLKKDQQKTIDEYDDATAQFSALLSDWVKNIPIIGGVVDFASNPGGWITDRFAEGAEFFFNDGLQNIKTTSTKSILGKSFNNLLGKKTGTFYSTVSFVNKSVVMPTAASILSLVMLIQLIKISPTGI